MASMRAMHSGMVFSVSGMLTGATLPRRTARNLALSETRSEVEGQSVVCKHGGRIAKGRNNGMKEHVEGINVWELTDLKAEVTHVFNQPRTGDLRLVAIALGLAFGDKCLDGLEVTDNRHH